MLAILAMLAVLRVAAGGCAPLFPCVARRSLGTARSGRESRCADRTGKRDCDMLAWAAAVRSGLRQTAAAGVQLRVCRLQRLGLRSRAAW